MGFIWSALSGCPSLPHLTAVTALLLMLAHLFSAVVGFLLVAVNWFLSVTILNTGGVHQALADLFGPNPTGAVSGIYVSMAGMGLVIAGVATVWAVMRHQEALMTGTRPEYLRGLAGRAGGAVVWIVATPVALYLLTGINDHLVGTIQATMDKNPWIAMHACSVTGGLGIPGLGTTAIGIALGILFWQVIGLALIAGIVAAVGQYLLRLFQIVFWGALLPVAAGASVADPQRRAWTYVWGQVTGSIFTQVAMALGLFLTERVLLAGALTTAKTALLSYLMGVAGFFIVSRIPRYFQELQGHSVGGGSEMAAIAGGYIMGRFGTQALAATAGGQIAGQLFGASREATTAGLNRGGGIVARTFQRARESAYAAQGVNRIADAQAQVTSGLVGDEVQAGAIKGQGELDAYANQPLSRNVTAALRQVTNDPSIPMTPQAPRGMGGIGPPPPGGPGDPPPAASPAAGATAWLATATPPADGVDTVSPPPAEPAGAPRVGTRGASGEPRTRSGPVSYYGAGSQSAVGLPAADFAARMAPLAQQYLHGQLVGASRQPAVRGWGGIGGMSPTRHADLVQDPASATRGETVFHRRVLDRVHKLHDWTQQLAANPTASVAALFNVAPDALNTPAIQAEIEQKLHESMQTGGEPPLRQSFLRPVARDGNHDYSIGS
jgi:hypothetical protein